MQKGQIMFNKLFRFLTLSAVLAIVATANVSAAPKAKAKRVKGSLAGNLTYSPTNIAAGVYSVTVQSVGTLSHLGRVKGVWQGDVALDANLSATPLTGLGWTLTNQVGTLHGTILWQATNSASPLVYSVTGTFQTAGGTGRLQGANGQGTITGTINALTGKSTLHLDALVNGLRTKVP
jgi:hypothetical protein